MVWRNRWSFCLIPVLVMGLVLPSLSLASDGSAAQPQRSEAGPLDGLPPGLAGVLARALADELPAPYQISSAGTGYRAANPAQGLDLVFTPRGVEVSHQAGGWRWRLALTVAGYGRDLRPVPAAVLSADGPRLAYQRGDPAQDSGMALTEWYLNTTWGLEQGFDLLAPPQKAQAQPDSAPLNLQLSLTGDLTPSLDRNALLLSDDAGQVVARYTGLHAFDAEGHLLPATLALSPGAGTLSILVDDSAAAYPITIDPWIQSAKLLAGDGSGKAVLGDVMAIDGSTVVAGMPSNGLNGTDSGAAYVFTRSGASWASATETAVLTASDAAAGDFFGTSVAISGDTIVVGAPGKNLQQGAAYLYVKPTPGWGSTATRSQALPAAAMNETAKLVPSDGGEGDQLGDSVAIDGDTVAVGAPYADNWDGAVYLFAKSGAWTGNVGETAKLSVPGTGTSILLGQAVDLDGDTVVAGAPGDNLWDGALYVFVKPVTGGWTSATTANARLTVTAAVGSEQIGYELAIDGDTVVAGAPDDDTNKGAAFLFVRPAAGWIGALNETARLTASDGASGHYFGCSVDVDGNTVVIGARGTSEDRGSAYVFSRPVAGWAPATESAKLVLSAPQPLDGLGYSVAVGDDTVVAGAPGSSGWKSAAYIFDQPTTGLAPAGPAPAGQWSGTVYESAKLTASDAGGGDQFGWSVSASGDIVVVGAPSAENTFGAAYLFVLPAPTGQAAGAGPGAQTLTESVRLIPNTRHMEQWFGTAAAVSGDTVVVGAPGDSNEIGAVWVMDKPTGGWTSGTGTLIMDRELAPLDIVQADRFGAAVAIDGDTIVVGSPGQAGDRGAAYIFEKPTNPLAAGAEWPPETPQAAKLEASDRAENDRFGAAVAVSGDTVVIGADGDDRDSLTGLGAVYVFVEPQGGWDAPTWTLNETRKLVAADGAKNDSLGESVAIDGDTVVAGAPSDDFGLEESLGSAYLWVKPPGGWPSTAARGWPSTAALRRPSAPAEDLAQTAKLTASDGEQWDELGISVAIGGRTVLVAAGGDGGDSVGSVYVYTEPGGGWSANGGAHTQDEKIEAGDRWAYDRFGNSVAVSGTVAVIGAPGERSEQGTAYLFGTPTTIVVEKKTEPGGWAQAFAFSGDASGSLQDGDTLTHAVTPGTYHSTETVPDGWHLASIECDDTDSSGDTATGTATFQVQAGEAVKCTFTNHKVGTIIVAKKTDPAGYPGCFAFSGDPSGCVADGAQITAAGLAPGTYTSTEALPPGWVLASIACDDSDSTGDVPSRTATFRLQAAETVTCTFANEGPHGVYLPLVMR